MTIRESLTKAKTIALYYGPIPGLLILIVGVFIPNVIGGFFEFVGTLWLGLSLGAYATCSLALNKLDQDERSLTRDYPQSRRNYR